MPRRRTLEAAGRLLTEADQAGAARILLLTPGWGTSGYYPAEVIAEHGPAAFPAGTHMYLDHPTAQEAVSRPERSVRDLAGVTTSDAVWDPAGDDGPGLYAEARFFAGWRQVIAEAAGDVGLSIRALGRSRQGEAEGRRGRIVESIDRGLSVDVVTRAGRGGRILELIEAARNTDMDEAWSHNETREMLTQHLHSTRGDDEDRYLWVRDLGDDWVVWEDYGPDAPDPGYFRAGYSLSDDGTVSLGDREKVTARTVYTPTSSIEPIESDSPEGTDMPLTDDDITRIGEAFTAAIAPLTEALTPAAETETEQPAEMTESERTAREQLLTLTATRHGEQLFAEGGQLADYARTLPQVTITRLIETAALQAPHSDDLTLDTAALGDRLEEAAKQARTEIAAATGSGRVTAGPAAASTGELAESTDRLAQAFTDLGLSESAAKTAAAGR